MSKGDRVSDITKLNDVILCQQSITVLGMMMALCPFCLSESQTNSFTLFPKVLMLTLIKVI